MEWDERSTAITGPDSMPSQQDSFVGLVEVRVRETADGILVNRCTGSLIRADAAITSARCLVDGNRVLPTGAILFYLMGPNAGMQALTARKVTFHPAFRLDGMINQDDLALVFFETRATGVTPGRLAAKGSLQ